MSDAVPPPTDPPSPPPAVRRGHVRQHLIILFLCCGVIGAAFCLQVLPDGDRVSLRGASEVKVPPLCLARNYLGIKCPGCGLTRSFVYLAHGDVAASLRAHRLGWVLFALTLSQIPYRLGAAFRPPRTKAPGRFGKWVGWVLMVLMLANWAGDLLFAR